MSIPSGRFRPGGQHLPDVPLDVGARRLQLPPAFHAAEPEVHSGAQDKEPVLPAGVRLLHHKRISDADLHGAPSQKQKQPYKIQYSTRFDRNQAPNSGFPGRKTSSGAPAPAKRAVRAPARRTSSPPVTGRRRRPARRPAGRAQRPRPASGRAPRSRPPAAPGFSARTPGRSGRRGRRAGCPGRAARRPWR